MNAPYWNIVPVGAGATITTGKSVTYTKAVTIGGSIAGVSFTDTLSASTYYNKDHKQSLDAGHKAYDHDVFSYYGSVKSKNCKVFYAY
jgi:hypothetical protein